MPVCLFFGPVQSLRLPAGTIIRGVETDSDRHIGTLIPGIQYKTAICQCGGAAPSTNPEEIPSACRSTQRPWGTASVWTALESEPDAPVPDAVQAARENIIMPARSEDRIVCTDFMVASRQLCGFGIPAL